MATTRSMEFSVEVETPSSIVRKLTIKVPSHEVQKHLDRGLVTVQKTAQVKGFRVGQVPLSLVKQYYGEDVRHRVFHNLIDESFDQAVKEKEIRVLGRPHIDTPNHQTGKGDHDHTLKEDQELTFTATFEVMPEVKVKGYTGIAVNQEKVDITDDQVEKVVINLQNSQGQLVPASSGLALADGSESSRPVQNGDFVDIKFSGGMVTDNTVQIRPDMQGSRMIEVGANTWIPGFEENLIGMRRGETKTFRLTFPSDFAETSLAGHEVEFTVTVNEVKEKKLPVLDDEFAKQVGHENLGDLRVKAREFLQRERIADSEQKLQSELLGKIIEKNHFDVPVALIEGQTRALAEDWAQDLKKQGYEEKFIQQTITHEIENLKKRAENQVRASLVLEAIAKEEGISINTEEVEMEIDRLSVTMNVEKTKLQEYYAKNSGRKEDLEFRLRQERTIKFLLDKAKIKSVAAQEK